MGTVGVETASIRTRSSGAQKSALPPQMWGRPKIQRLLRPRARLHHRRLRRGQLVWSLCRTLTGAPCHRHRHHKTRPLRLRHLMLGINPRVAKRNARRSNVKNAKRNTGLASRPTNFVAAVSHLILTVGHNARKSWARRRPCVWCRNAWRRCPVRQHQRLQPWHAAPWHVAHHRKRWCMRLAQRAASMAASVATNGMAIASAGTRARQTVPPFLFEASRHRLCPAPR